jgi:beta-phosphoglucomutase family hydrolase
MAAGVRAVLWDMDGVLVDTGEWHYRAWVQALQEEGIAFDWDVFQRTFGMDNASILELIFEAPPDPGTVRRIGGRKEALFREFIHGQAKPMPGVVEWLGRLSQRGVAQAVASSAPAENVEFIMDELGIRGYFGALVSCDGLPGKPDPMIFLEAARRLGVPPIDCVVVEDGLPGLQAAHSAGMRCIGVTTTHPASALSLADRVVERLDDLPEDGFDGLSDTGSGTPGD